MKKTHIFEFIHQIWNHLSILKRKHLAFTSFIKFPPSSPYINLLVPTPVKTNSHHRWISLTSTLSIHLILQPGGNSGFHQHHRGRDERSPPRSNRSFRRSSRSRSPRRNSRFESSNVSSSSSNNRRGAGGASSAGTGGGAKRAKSPARERWGRVGPSATCRDLINPYVIAVNRF